MAINDDKIMTISAKEYCEMNGKKLSDYSCKGVHGKYKIKKSKSLPMRSCIISFYDDAQDEIEAVVDLKIAVAGTKSSVIFIGSGTALIPRK